MAGADPTFAAGAEGLMEKNRDVDMVSPPRSPFLTSPCLKVKPSKSKRTLEESQKVSIRRRGRPATNKMASIPGSEATKPDLPQVSCAVKVCTNSSIDHMECKSPGNASESKASERICMLCTEDSPVTTVESTPLAKSSCGSGCAGKDPSKCDKSSARAIEVCTPSLKKPSKRKRSLFQETLDAESKAAHIQQFQQEIASLVKYFNELVEDKCHINASEATDVRSKITNAMIACLLEESRLPFSKLVQHIHEKLKDHSDQNGGLGTTLAFVRSSVLFIGQRSLYGILKADADVLEDESELCLWCWEVRDLKLLPRLQRDLVSIRRRCRKKIHDRITALSAMISALSSSGLEESNKIDLAKAEEMLAKADDEMSIRAIAADLLQKNNAQIMVKQAKLKEKEAVKERERNERKVDMEQKRLDRELKREKVQQEKERERLEREASKERARAQKEALNQEKELKRQQEEAEKERRRREKEEAEVKKQLAIQKQATIMDRFLHSKKDPPNTSQVGNAAVKGTTPSPSKENGHIAVMELMDHVLFQGSERQHDGLLRSHLAAWHEVHHQISTQRPISWGMRRKPKVPLFKELRLQGASAEAEASGKVASITSKRRTCGDPEDVDEFKAEKLVNEWEEQALNDSPPSNNVIGNAHRDSQFLNKRRKLLQFDKSYRPAYYGTFSKKSDAVGPRHPFRKDSSLDYENDSDEEWEEEDPGESLSDCDKDEEEEKIEVEKEKIKAEEDYDSEDGFFVPDGYLSENEGVCLDDMESDADEDLLEDLPAGKASEGCVMNEQLESENELHAFERQQKLLENATERALRSNHAFIVSNFYEDRTDMIRESVAPGLGATHKLEQICLQALRIRVFSPDILIELPSESPMEPNLEDEQESCKRQRKNCMMLPDSYLPELVCVIQSSTQGMNKIVESLLKKFPHIAKRQLKNKIREISDFVDNQWKVKKEVLEKLGMSSLPGEASEITKSPALQLKGIATFFSKRCLPPEVAGISESAAPSNDGTPELEYKVGFWAWRTCTNLRLEDVN